MSDMLLSAIESLTAPTPARPAPAPLLRRLADIEREDIHWAWKGWLASGKLAILGGHPGDGKSTLSLAIAARLSTGAPMPDGAPTTPTNILVLPSEDGAADTIVPRLEDHGADLDRCFVLDEIAEPTEDDASRTRPVSLTRDLPVIESVIVAYNIGVLILDPITTFMPKADRNAEGDVRDALHPVLKMLDRTGCSCLSIMHVGKPNGTTRRPLQQLLGSTAFGAIARLVWMVAPDPNQPADDDAPQKMVLGVVKSNLWVKPPTLMWSRPLDQPVQWHGSASTSIDEAMSAVPDADGGRDSDAARFLREELIGGSVASVDLFKRAKAEGISESQLRTAGKHLQVEKFKEAGTAVGQWYWKLPSKRREDTPPVLHDATVSGERSADDSDLQPGEEAF